MDIPSSTSLSIQLSYSDPMPQPYVPRPPAPIAPVPIPPKMKTIYFGYGSNLWLHQMRQRCPTSTYLGIARLRGYQWIIYERGYANIVEIDPSPLHHHHRHHHRDENAAGDEHDYAKEVWGLVYSLEEQDEKRLDGNEGVPNSYQKEMIECEFWTASASREVVVDTEQRLEYAVEGKPDITKRPGREKMLVYINRELTRTGDIRKEYVYRMNCGIADAVGEGVPKAYVEQVLRKWIPAEEGRGVDERDRVIAARQAKSFEDEERL